MPEKPFVLFHVPTNHIKDVDDVPISDDEARKITGVLKAIGIENVGEEDFRAFGGALWNPETAAKDPKLAFYYAISRNARFPAGEPAIAKDAEWSYQYAHDVLRARFPAGESAIAEDAPISYYYAVNVLGGPFPEGEEAISQDPWVSYLYAFCVLNGPFPLGEPVIAKYADWSYEYAHAVLKGRFLAGEPAIAKNKFYAGLYDRRFGTNLVK